MAQLKVTLGIGFIGATHEDIIDIPDEYLDELTKDEVNEVINDYWKDWSNNYIDGGAELI